MKMLNLEAHQLQFLRQRHDEVALELLRINFEKPEDDAQMIRHHAYLKGKLHILAILIEDDFEQPELQQPGDQQ